MPRRSAIGLDIGSAGARAAQLSFGRDGVTLQKYGEVSLPAGAVRDGEVVDEAAVTAAVKRLWAEHRFSSKHVHLGVANQRVLVREVDLPDVPLADLKRSLPFQVQEVLPMAVEGTVLDFHPLERRASAGGAPVLRGLLVAAGREMVLSSVRAVEAAGLRVTSVDLASFALLRSVGARLDDDHRTEALVDVGARVTNIVVHTHGVPHFVRMLGVGGQDATDAVVEALGVPFEEAEQLKLAHGPGRADDPVLAQALVDGTSELVDGVRGTLDYFSSTWPDRAPGRLLLSGGGSLVAGLAEQLGFVTRLPVQAADAVARLHVDRSGPAAEALDRDRPRMAVPVGLALAAAR